MEKLQKIQSELKAPKNQRNNFGKYNYRSCEDILEAVKPLLAANGCTLTISDEIKEVGSLVYVEAIATLSDGAKNIMVKAQAGINPDRKGMDIAQSFGSSSSYARKYALNGLFLIDDTKDADATNGADTQSNARTISTLDDKGYAFLISDKSTKEQVNMALKERKMKPEQKGALTELLKTK